MRTDYLNHELALADRKWFVVDAKDVVLGRIASKVAKVLQGKHKPTFAPHQDVGDFVIVINADKVRVTGKKLDQKNYFRHSGYAGGGKLIPLRRMIERRPEYVIEHAVRLMLPKNALGRRMLTKLKVYPGEQHPHQAQQPEPLNLD